MWNRTLSKCANPGRDSLKGAPSAVSRRRGRLSSGAVGLSHGFAGRRRAFTLIELLVVVAIIALLLSILLPGLAGAREQARTVVCGQRLADLGRGLGNYTTEEDEWIPGLNTSGAGIEMLKTRWPSNPALLHNPLWPVQTFDWMTPLLARTTELPALRAERFRYLLETMRCPSQVAKAIVYEGGLVSPDRADFQARVPYRAISYLMPATFQYVGDDHARRVLGYYEGTSNPAYAERVPTIYSVRPDRNYLPVLSRIGPPSRKVLAADGTRYLMVQGTAEMLDFDPYPAPNHFGSFTDTGCWWGGSTAWGVRQGTQTWDGDTMSYAQPGRGFNLSLSYRHGNRAGLSGRAQTNSGRMNMLFFDGHVENAGDKRSRRIDVWYPSGSTVNDPSNGMFRVVSDQPGQPYVVP